jgi:hypothetical protein
MKKRPKHRAEFWLNLFALAAGLVMLLCLVQAAVRTYCWEVISCLLRLYSY